MVEGYLIGARSFFSKWDHDNNYQIFIPEQGKVLGYFKDKNFNFSDSGDKFYENVDIEHLKDLSTKVAKGKFSKKVKIDEDVLLFLESAESDFIRAKNKVDSEYQRLTKFFDYIKSRK